MPGPGSLEFPPSKFGSNSILNQRDESRERRSDGMEGNTRLFRSLQILVKLIESGSSISMNFSEAYARVAGASSHNAHSASLR